MNQDCILVTGAAGLIGRTMLARLKAGSRAAIGIDLTPKPQQQDVEAADLTDIHRLHAIAAKHGVTAVVHCGAVSGPMVMTDNPYGIIQANLVGTANIIELARILAMRRVVFCSSASAYGPTSEPPDGRPLTEDTPLRPSSVYGATKAACEQIIAGYRQQHGLDAVSIRLCWVYGPGRTTDCVIRTMIQDAQAGRSTRLPFGRDFHRQFIHVDDAVGALLAGLDAPLCDGATYNATDGAYHTLGGIAGLVSRLMDGADIALEPGADPMDDVHHRFDISAIHRDLGFRPRVALEDGIRSYAAWLAARA